MGKKLQRSVVIDGLVYGPDSPLGDELPSDHKLVKAEGAKDDPELNPKLFMNDEEIVEQREKERAEREERARKRAEAARDEDESGDDKGGASRPRPGTARK